ncbi:uroporphyrinogen decarboxylase family protein, partial [Chloroflexota bacterium]
MTLTHKERMRRAISYEPVDRIPTQINMTTAVAEKLAAHRGIPLAELAAHLDNHMVRVDLAAPSRLSADGRTRYDWWGAGFDTQEEGYFVNDSPLGQNKDLDAFPWPDPHSPGLLDDAAATIQAQGDEYFITPNFGFSLFERAWSLRGLDIFMMDMALDPVWTAELLDRIVAIQLVLIERYLNLGVDGGYFGDDYGAQKSLLFSPAMWRDLIKPRLAKMFVPFRERGLPVLMHSDGDIAEIVPDLVEIGLTTLNPVQPEVIDHAWLRETFAGKLAFYGGISTQTVLPHGTPKEVQAAIQAATQTLAPDGTGLLLAPSHRMM